MSVSINNLFNYSRSLPVPFDTMTNKKVKVASMYGAKTESTLCGSVIKAVHAMCRCMNGTGEGAVGQIDTNKSVAEYKSSVGPDAYHLVVFDAASGSALASVYDKNTELIEQYVAHPSQRDGAAIFFALMPFLMSDAEFDETFQEYYDQFIAGYQDSFIRPIDENTVLGNNNTNVVYRVIVEDKNGILNDTNSSNFMVVYNGNLGKDLAYPAMNATITRVYDITGDVIILNKDDSSYLGSKSTNGSDTWNIDFKGELKEGLLYVSYNWNKQGLLLWWQESNGGSMDCSDCNRF